MEITGAEFDEVVLRAPGEVTVVVDFWAPWCAPCRTLGPAIERVAAALGGRVRLVKVNIDAAPELASRWGVQSIPTVKMFNAGREVGGFIGALPEAQVREEIEAVAGSEADDLTADAEELLRSGDVAGAEAQFRAAIEADGTKARPKALLAGLLVQKGELADARALLESIDGSATEHLLAQALLGEIEMREACEAAGGIESCRAAAAADPGNLAARLGVGVCLAAQGEYRAALDELIKVVEADRDFNDGAARAAMVSVFAIVGQRSPLADEYRKRLAALLY
jgi:putative thioredoxin